jgi:hypothetical protein
VGASSGWAGVTSQGVLVLMGIAYRLANRGARIRMVPVRW